jgi:hypothetical protein
MTIHPVVLAADAEALVNLGMACGQQGRLKKARQEARLALELGCEPARQLLARLG